MNQSFWNNVGKDCVLIQIAREVHGYSIDYFSMNRKLKTTHIFALFPLRKLLQRETT